MAASLKAIRQMWKEGQNQIQSDLKDDLSQLSNATAAITQIAGLAQDISKDKKEKKELDEFAKKNDLEYNERTGKYYGIDKNNPKGDMIEVDASYMKALKDNPSLYEDSARDMLFKEDGTLRKQFKAGKDFSADVKKDGITGLFQRIIPGGDSGYETIGQHDVRKELTQYKDWVYGTGDFERKQTKNPDYDPDMAGKYVVQKSKDDPTLIEATDGGGILYESLVPEFNVTGGPAYTTGGGLDTSKFYDRITGQQDSDTGFQSLFTKKDDIPDFMKGAYDKASAELQSAIDTGRFSNTLKLLGDEPKDYTRKIDAQGNIVEEADWERLASDLNEWQGYQPGDELNVTAEGLKSLVSDMDDAAIEKWMRYSPEMIDKVNVGGLKGLGQRIVPGGESGKEYDDRARINAALGVLYNVENREDWTIEDHLMMGDDTLQDFYEHFVPTEADKKELARNKRAHEEQMEVEDSLTKLAEQMDLVEANKKAEQEWLIKTEKELDVRNKEWEADFLDPEKSGLWKNNYLRDEDMWSFNRLVESHPSFKDSDYYKARPGVRERDEAIASIPTGINPFQRKKEIERINKEFIDTYGDLKIEDIKAMNAYKKYEADQAEENRLREEEEKRQLQIKKAEEEQRRREYVPSDEHIKKLENLSKDIYNQASVFKQVDYGLNITTDQVGEAVDYGIDLGKDIGLSLRNQFTQPFSSPSGPYGTNMPQYYMGNSAASDKDDKKAPRYYMGDANNSAISGSKSNDVVGPEDDTMFAIIKGELSKVTPAEHKYIQEHGEKGANHIYEVAKAHAKKIGIDTDNPKEWPIRGDDDKPYYWFAEAMGAVQWIGGAFGKAKAAKKEVKHIQNNVLPALGKAAMDTSQEGIQMADKFQEEKDMLLDQAADQVADQADDIAEKQGEMFKKTGGLKVGAVQNFGEKAMDVITDKFDQVSDNIAFQFKDKMEGMRDKIGSGLEEIGMSVKSAVDRMNAMKKKRKWYKNLF